VPATIWRNFMTSALAVDRRSGPALPREFRVPERREQPEPRRERQSPLPADWSDRTKPLRDVAKRLKEIFGER
jgi:penicillin-binding protein 1A